MTRQLIVAGAVVIGLLGAYVFLTSAPPERDSSSTWGSSQPASRGPEDSIPGRCSETVEPASVSP